MTWSIDINSGHCVQKDGLTAYIDGLADPTRFVRCLGPFGAEQMCQERVLQLMRLLTDTLEAKTANQRKIVVWGSYQPDSEYVEHVFPILGSTCGFVPNLVLREMLYVGGSRLCPDNSQTQRNAKKLSRFGITVDWQREKICLGDVDARLLHPEQVDSHPVLLASYLESPEFARSINRFSIELGRLDWNRTGPQLRVVN